MTSLYIVATPIGNLEDITLRALRVLREVDLIASENMSTTRKLLSNYNIKTKLTSYRENNKSIQIPHLLKALKTHDVALVSEAGTPTISDPGYDLIIATRALGIPIITLPGPSAVTAAIAVSGIQSQHFLYLGFLPRRSLQRRKILKKVKALPYTIVCFEAPHRLKKSLVDIHQMLGDRTVSIIREISKIHEEVFSGSVSKAIDHFQHPIGEFTLVIQGSQQQPASVCTPHIVQELKDLKSLGIRAKAAVSTVEKSYGVPHKKVYKEWLQLNQEQ